MAKVASRLCRRYLISNGDDFTTTLSSASIVTGPEATLPIFIVGEQWGAWVSSHTGEVVRRTDRLTERERGGSPGHGGRGRGNTGRNQSSDL